MLIIKVLRAWQMKGQDTPIKPRNYFLNSQTRKRTKIQSQMLKKAVEGAARVQEELV